MDQTYQANGRVAALLPVGNTIYLAGSFTSLRPYGAAAGTGEVARNHLAAVDRTTGQLLSWNPGANKEAYALAASPDGSTIYVGGLFSQVAGQSRLKVAAFSSATGVLTKWAPSANNKVFAIAVTGIRVYLGGSFTTINGVARANAASVDTSGVLDAAWHPSLSAPVRALLSSADGTSIYAGGDFVSVNGDTKQKHLVSLSASNASIQQRLFHPGYPLYDLTADATTMYMAGNGSGGNAASASLATGAKGWSVQTDGGIQAVSVLNGSVYLGGHFDNVCPTGVATGGVSGFHCTGSQLTRHKILAVDAATGSLDPWAPGANSPLGVFALTGSGGALHVGGDFTKLGKPDSLGQATQVQQGYGQFG